MFFIYKSTSLIINTVYGLYSALSRFLRAGVEVGSLAPDGGEGGGAEHALVPYASLTAAAVAPKVEVVGAPLPPDLRGGDVAGGAGVGGGEHVQHLEHLHLGFWGPELVGQGDGVHSQHHGNSHLSPALAINTTKNFHFYISV